MQVPQINYKLEYLKRKQDLILKDFDTAFSWYQHIESQIYVGRSLVVTLILAYVGFLFTIKVSSNAVVTPLLIIPIPFILNEIYRRGHLIFLGKNIRHIEKMFATEDENNFYDLVHGYTFRDMRLQYGVVFGNLILWIKYMLNGILDVDAIIWYIFVIVSTTIAYVYFYT